MKKLVSLVAAVALCVSSLVLPAFGHEKPLPPAFGKELVPDQQSQERNESKAAESEEHQDPPKRPVVHHGQRGQKLHILLDGSEDGDDDGSGDDGGEF
jgi:hypothetical protein